MTDEEYHSLKETYKLLCDVLDPKKTPRVPKPVRDKARHCLKYFPVRRTLKELEGGVGERKSFCQATTTKSEFTNHLRRKGFMVDGHIWYINKGI